MPPSDVDASRPRHTTHSGTTVLHGAQTRFCALTMPRNWHNVAVGREAVPPCALESPRDAAGEQDPDAAIGPFFRLAAVLGLLACLCVPAGPNAGGQKVPG